MIDKNILEQDSKVFALKKEIAEKFAPQFIIVFGSYASYTATNKSDIDLCIVIEVSNKKELNMKINEIIYDENGLGFDKPVDILIYTPEEWENLSKQSGTFANLIRQKGVVVYGRQ